MGYTHKILEEANVNLDQSNQQNSLAPPNGRQIILDEARAITSADRNKQYGDPEDNFRNIAALWTGYVQARFPDVKFSPSDVAAMSALIKVARLATNPTHKDSWVDLAGYAACGGDIGLRNSTK